MNDNNYGDSSDDRRNRRDHVSRENAPRATRSTRYKKKRGAGPLNVGGVHKRRNKHWGW